MKEEGKEERGRRKVKGLCGVAYGSNFGEVDHLTDTLLVMQVV